jgi:broad specificity phosphatase PhoE
MEVTSETMATVESHETDLGEALGCEEPATWDAMLTDVVRLREFESGVLIGKTAREVAKAEPPTLATTEERELWVSVVRSGQTPYGETLPLADAIADADARTGGVQ